MQFFSANLSQVKRSALRNELSKGLQHGNNVFHLHFVREYIENECEHVHL